MTEKLPAPFLGLRPRRVAVLALLSAGVALAITLLLGNFMPAGATQCDPQVVKAQKVDAAATGALAALNPTGNGRGYADLSFRDKDGNPVTIADFKGKALLVNFWASWCVPCREEMPALAAIQQKYDSDGFMMLPINLDLGPGGLDKAKAFLAEEKLTSLPLYADSTFSAFDRLKAEAVSLGLPTTLLLDEQGCEIAVLQGPAEWDSPEGHAVVEALIAG